VTTRLLPLDEWPKLAGTEAETVWPLLDPLTSHVLVVEDNDAIVGAWVLLSVLHAECLWIAPAHRGKTAVARRLWAFMQRTARALGAPAVATAAMTDDVRKLLEHVGATKVPGDHYAMRVQ
jgi:tellurite resistance-related uncharacterized protein